MATTTTFIGKTATDGSHSTISLPAYNQSAGNCIVIMASHISGGAPTSVTDTAGNSYIPIPTLDSAPNIYIFYCTNCLGNAANVVVVNCASTIGFSAAFGWDVAGADSVCPIDVLTRAHGSSTTPTVTINTLYANESIICLSMGTSQYNTGSAGTGFTSDGNTGQGGNHTFGQHKDVTSTITNTAESCTISPSVNWAYALVAVSDTKTAFARQLGGTGNGGGSIAAATTNATVQSAGECIVVIIQTYNADTVQPIDTAGNNYLLLYNALLQGTIYKRAWYAPNCLGNAANVITITKLGGGNLTYTGMLAFSIRGLAGGGISDLVQAAAYSSVSSFTDTITTTHAREIIIDSFNESTASISSATPGVGFVPDFFGVRGAFAYDGVEPVISIQSSVALTWSGFSGNGNYNSLILSFADAQGVPNSLMLLGCGT